MDVKTTAFVLRATDYKENDKLLTLFSTEYGKITATLKGARKPTAKLKFASQPFALIEFVLAERKGFYTVTQAQSVDQFYALTGDVNKYYSACTMTQLVCEVLQEGQSEFALFTALANVFKTLCYEKTDAKLFLISFFLKTAEEQGMGLRLSACSVCGKEGEEMAFSFRDGGVTCPDCATKESVPLKREVYLLLRHLAEAEPDELVGLKGEDQAEKGALRLLADYFTDQAEIRLPALSQYLAI